MAMALASVERFAPNHRWDRNFSLGLIAVVWLVIIAGFGRDLVDHFVSHRRPFPWVVHAHAAVFVGWVALLTTQIAFVRAGRTGLHRRLGLAGAALAPVVVVMGLVVAFVHARLSRGTPDYDPALIWIQLLDMAAFAIVAAAGLSLRRESVAHRRLMLLTVLTIIDAGFFRLWGGEILQAIGEGALPDYIAFYGGNGLLIGAMAAYDLATRRALHPAFVGGAMVALIFQALAAFLYASPGWRPVAETLIRG